MARVPNIPTVHRSHLGGGPGNNSAPETPLVRMSLGLEDCGERDICRGSASVVEKVVVVLGA